MLKPYLSLPRPVLILCLGSFINRAGSMLVIFLTIYLKDELALTPEFATMAMGAYGLGSLVASAVGGHLADRIGRRAVMLASMFGGAAMLAIFGYLTVSWYIILATGVYAVLMESYRPAASAMIADLVTPEQRTHAFGLMYVSINLGFAIAPPLGAFLIHAYSFVWLFRVDALTSFCYAAIILVTISETLPRRLRARETAQDRDRSIDASDATMPTSKLDSPSIREAVSHMLHDRAFICFCLATLFVSSAYMQSITTFPLYLSELGFDSTVYGKIIAVNGVMIVLLQLPVTSLINRYDRTSMLVVGALLMAVGFGLIGVFHSLGLLVVTIVIWTLGEMMLAPLSPAVVSDLAPVALRARYMGAFTMSWSISMTVAVPIGGIVLQRAGGGYLWAGTFVLGIVAAVLFAMLRRFAITPVAVEPT